MLKPFFLRVNETTADGMPDLHDETPNGYENLDAAIEAGKEQIREHMGGSVIYTCRPVCRIEYGPPRVVKVKEAG